MRTLTPAVMPDRTPNDLSAALRWHFRDAVAGGDFRAAFTYAAQVDAAASFGGAAGPMPPVPTGGYAVAVGAWADAINASALPGYNAATAYVAYQRAWDFYRVAYAEGGK